MNLIVAVGITFVIVFLIVSLVYWIIEILLHRLQGKSHVQFLFPS